MPRNIDLERMDYQEFIARVTSHIPDKGQVMVRYFGLYANAHHRLHHRLSRRRAHPQPPEADLCRRQTSPASHRFSGSFDGRRGQR